MEGEYRSHSINQSNYCGKTHPTACRRTALRAAADAESVGTTNPSTNDKLARSVTPFAWAIHGQTKAAPSLPPHQPTATLLRSAFGRCDPAPLTVLARPSVAQ